MVRNGKTYGILTTMKGWCFLRRVNGGGLYITRMFGDFMAWQGISLGAAAEGYHNTFNFTIMQGVYYLSSLAESTNDLPETPICNVASGSHDGYRTGTEGAPDTTAIASVGGSHCQWQTPMARSGATHWRSINRPVVP